MHTTYVIFVSGSLWLVSASRNRGFYGPAGKIVNWRLPPTMELKTVNGMSFERFPRLWQTVGPISAPPMLQTPDSFF